MCILIDVCNIQEVKFGLLDLVSWSLGQSSITKRGSVTMQGVVEFGGLRLSGDGSWIGCCGGSIPGPALSTITESFNQRPAFLCRCTISNISPLPPLAPWEYRHPHSSRSVPATVVAQHLLAEQPPTSPRRSPKPDAPTRRSRDSFDPSELDCSNTSQQ